MGRAIIDGRCDGGGTGTTRCGAAAATAVAVAVAETHILDEAGEGHVGDVFDVRKSVGAKFEDWRWRPNLDSCGAVGT